MWPYYNCNPTSDRQELWNKWRGSVNMTAAELQRFMDESLVSPEQKPKRKGSVAAGTAHERSSEC